MAVLWHCVETPPRRYTQNRPSLAGAFLLSCGIGDGETKKQWARKRCQHHADPTHREDAARCGKHTVIDCAAPPIRVAQIAASTCRYAAGSSPPWLQCR